MADNTWRRALAAIALLAFLLRLAVALYRGDQAFFSEGYSFYLDFADSLAAGRGFLWGDGRPTAYRPPGYPAFLALFLWGGRSFLPLAAAQAALGAATAVCASLLAAAFWGTASRAALAAGALVAVYPYFVWHDTALQETVVYTFLNLLAILLLIRGRAGWAGVVVGLAILTRSTLLPFAILVPAWLFWRFRSCRPALRFALTVAAVIAPWLIRSHAVHGAFVLSTEAGLCLFDGHNPMTFSHYPVRSIDDSNNASLAALSPAERDHLERLEMLSELAADQWLNQRALAYIAADPFRALRAGFRKLHATFGLLPSPRGSSRKNALHAFSYGAVLLLGLAGMWRARDANLALIALAFAAFASVVFVYFGHSSHRIYLDVLLIAYAPGASRRLYDPQQITFTPPT